MGLGWAIDVARMGIEVAWERQAYNPHVQQLSSVWRCCNCVVHHRHTPSPHTIATIHRSTPSQHTIAMLQLWVCGSNRNGQLGLRRGTNLPLRRGFAKLGGGELHSIRIVQLSCGSAHTCAVRLPHCLLPYCLLPYCLLPYCQHRDGYTRTTTWHSNSPAQLSSNNLSRGSPMSVAHTAPESHARRCVCVPGWVGSPSVPC